MARLWLDGFDHYNSQADLTNGNYQFVQAAATAPSTVQKRTGAKSLLLGTDGSLVKGFAASNEIWLGSALYPTRTDAPRHYCLGIFNNAYGGGNMTANNSYFTNGSCEGFIVYYQVGGEIAVEYWKGGVKTQLGVTTGAPIPNNAFSYLEVRVRNNTAAGGSAALIEVWLNGETKLLDLTGPSMTGAWAFGGYGKNSSGAVYCDDLYIDNAVSLGAQQCWTLFPNADQTPQDWALSGGANAFDLINDVPYNVSNYIFAANANEQSKFGLTDIPASTAGINGCRLCSVQALASSGSGTTKQSLLIGAATIDGASKALTTSPVFYNDLIDLGGYSIADVNAASLQFEKLS